MKFGWLSLLLGFVLGCSPSPPQLPTHQVPIERAVERLEASTIALVKEDTGEIYCSGVVIEGGKILTGRHCIEQFASSIPGEVRDFLGLPIDLTRAIGQRVFFRFDRQEGNRAGELPARILRIDAENDLALIEPETPLEGGISLATELPAIGEDVAHIGHPGGVWGWTYARGYVSGVRSMTGQKNAILQLNLPVYPGCSGGGLFNSRNELIGIVIAYSPAMTGDVSFAVSIATIRRFL